MKTLSSLKHIFLGLILFSILSIDVFAQQTTGVGQNFNGRWRLSAGGGPSLFFGDITMDRWIPDNSEWRFGGNVILERSLSPVFSLRGQAMYSYLAGRRVEWFNAHFETEIIEFNLNSAINISNLIGGYNPDRLINFNVIGGIGLTNYNTTLYDITTEAVIDTRGFGKGSGIGGLTLEGIVMGGLGMDFRLSDHVSLRLETANRIMNSDLLDIQESGFKYDVYNHSSLGISYTFGSSASRRLPPLAPESTVDHVVADKPEEKPKTEPLKPEISPYQAIMDAIEQEEPEKEPEPVYVYEPEEVKEPEPDPGRVEYRVQIRARINQPISKSYLEKRYNIPASDIKEDMHNGFYIYTVGSYPTYEEAASNRNRIRRENGVSDAFIVAFQYGKRLNKLP
jgi:hypothetical protein